MRFCRALAHNKCVQGTLCGVEGMPLWPSECKQKIEFGERRKNAQSFSGQDNLWEGTEKRKLRVLVR